MAHPVRIQLLRILGERIASPKEMGEISGVPVGTVAYHTRVLVELECAELVKTSPRRGATEHFYRAKPEGFINSRKWKAVPRLVRDELAGATFQELSVRVSAALEAETFKKREDSSLLCLPMQVDEKGWEEIRDLVAVAEQAICRAGLKATKRLADKPGIAVVVALAAFEAAGGHSE
jgi:hypothetical protein